MIKVFILKILLTLSLAAAAQNSSTGVSGIANITAEQALAHTDKEFYISGQIMWFKIYVTGQNSHKLKSLSKTAYATLTGPDGNTVLQAKIELQNGMGSGSFPIPGNTKSGTHELLVYTNLMKNHPSSIFKKYITIVNTTRVFDTTAFEFYADDYPNDLNPKKPFSGNENSIEANSRQEASYPLKIVPDKQNYQPRNQVNLNLINENGVAANLSLSVYKLNALTDRGGFMKEAEARNSPVKDIIEDERAILPEMNGFVIVARAGDANGRPAANVPIIVSLTGKLANVQFGESDEKGLAYFNFKNVYGPQQILIKTTPEYEEKIQLEVLKSFIRPKNIEPLPRAPFKNEFLEIVEEMHNHLEVSKAFSAGFQDQFFAENPDSLSFYGKANGNYLLDDYKRFVTMEEVLREYVKEVSVRIRNKSFYLLVWNKQLSDLHRYIEVNTMMDFNPPLVLIDGVPVTPDELMKYDPLKVRKLEVLGERYLLGKMTYDGILSFTTYKGSFDELELEKNDLLTDEQGWQYQRKFFMPDYNVTEVKTSRIPDFRELLYWEPQIHLDNESPAKITFFTGDLTGHFLVEVKGISADGQLIHETTVIEVNE